MLRMRDYVCVVCQHQWEKIARTDESPPLHCGQPVRLKIVAPAVKYVQPHYNAGLGMRVNDAMHLDRELRKANCYIPSKTDVLRAMETDQVEKGIEVTRPKRVASIKESVEKTYSALHLEGKI